MEGDLAFHTFPLSTLPITRYKSSKTKIFENMSKFHVFKQSQNLSNFKRHANEQKKKKIFDLSQPSHIQTTGLVQQANLTNHRCYEHAMTSHQSSPH
jgi:hypothetical protein